MTLARPWLVVCAAVPAVAAAAAQRPTFSAATDVVRVDALVERGGRPVGGLTAADFVVEDGGVLQTVSLLPSTEPLSVGTVLDVSGSVTGAQLVAIGHGVQAIAGALGPGDRQIVYGFAGRTRALDPEAARSVERVATALRQSGSAHTALFDAVYTAIVHGDRGAGGKLVIVLSDGQDNASWLDAQAIIEAAQRHEAAICAIGLRDPSLVAPGVASITAQAGLRVLTALADRTGGRFVHATRDTELAPLFAAMLHDYRQRYILSFTPTGVARGDGWHPLTVRLRGRRGTVHARSGYWSR
jgi:VWFA-related protein